MQTTLKEEHPYSIRLTVSLDKEDLAEYVRAAREAARKDLAVDGFRKGNVPDDVAEKHISDDQLREAALQFALEGSFSRAVQEQQWDVAKTEELKVTKNTPEALTYSVLVRVWPTVALADLSQCTVEPKTVSVTEEQVDQGLETLRNMRASFLDKEGPVAEGDRVEIDFSATKDGKAVPGAEGKSHPLVVGGSSFMPGFEEQLIGLRAGDRKEFDLTAPEDYAYPELAGKTLHFTVSVGKVQLVMRPEVNDEFAKSLKYESEASLRKAVRDSVQAQEAAKERDRIRLAIMDRILGATDVPAPDFLVAEETEMMIRRFESDLATKGLGLDLYLARLGKTRDELRGQWQDEAIRQVKMSLVVRQIIKDQHIMPGEDEVEASVQDAVARLSKQEGFSEEALDMTALRRTVADRVVTERALAYLEQTCVKA